MSITAFSINVSFILLFITGSNSSVSFARRFRSDVGYPQYEDKDCNATSTPNAEDSLTHTASATQPQIDSLDNATVVDLQPNEISTSSGITTQACAADVADVSNEQQAAVTSPVAEDENGGEVSEAGVVEVPTCGICMESAADLGASELVNCPTCTAQFCDECLGRAVVAKRSYGELDNLTHQMGASLRSFRPELTNCFVCKSGELGFDLGKRIIDEAIASRENQYGRVPPLGEDGGDETQPATPMTLRQRIRDMCRFEPQPLTEGLVWLAIILIFSGIGMVFMLEYAGAPVSKAEKITLGFDIGVVVFIVACGIYNYIPVVKYYCPGIAQRVRRCGNGESCLRRVRGGNHVGGEFLADAESNSPPVDINSESPPRDMATVENDELGSIAAP